MENTELFKKLHPREYFSRFLAQGIRPDGKGRSLSQCRKISIQPSPLAHSCGSALVRLGSTMIMCGISVAVQECLITSDGMQGQVICNVDVGAMCMASVAPGAPNAYAQSLSAQVQSLLQRTVDLNDLVIKTENVESELDAKTYAIILYVDMYCLNNDGNAFDAAVLAAMTALLGCKLPLLSIEDGNIVKSKDTRPLKFLRIPIPLTVSMFSDDTLLSDPTADEQDIERSSLSLAVCSRSGLVCFMSKQGGDRSSMSRQQLETCITRAKERVIEVQSAWKSYGHL